MGSAILVPSGGVQHLHIVCSEPMNFEGRPPNSCLLLNVSSVVPKCDATVILKAGDHPFIKHDSFVYFRYASIEPAQALENNVACNVYTAQPPAQPWLVKKIVASINASPFTTGEIQKIGDIVWKTTSW